VKLILERIYWKWLHWIWAGFILFATIANARTLEQLRLSELFAYDKPIHMILFGVQTALLLRAYFHHPYTKRTLITVVAVVVGYGFVTELLQALITTSRQFDYFDLVANTAGCLIAAYIAAK
jgi:uncharacterized membrane protein